MDLDGVFYCSHCMKKVDKDDICPHCGFDNRHVHNDSPALEAYTLLNDRYQLGSVIGVGGFAITYAAWDEKLWIPVAIKEYFPSEWIMRNSEETDEISVLPDFHNICLLGKERFLREARVLAMLQDIPGIVKVYNSFEENNTAYIVMEYVHGTTIDRYVKEHSVRPEKLLQMMRGPIDALTAVHKQGVLHRDIKPNNLLVQEDGSIKLIDFGAAAQIGARNNTVLLTRHFAPVEQYDECNGQLGPWTDVYGMSATLYALLTGKVPQDSVSRLRHDELEDLSGKEIAVRAYQRKAIKKGLIVSPIHRTQSMDEFRSMLYNIPMPEEVLRRKRFMHRVEGVSAALTAVLVVVMVNFTCGLPLGQGLLYSLRGDGFHIIAEINRQQERHLPESRLGLPVSAVDENAFSEDTTLRRLTVPGSIRQIGNMAFYQCSSLEEVTLQNGIQRLGSFTFSECENLTEVHVPESLNDFTADTFEGTSPQITVWGSRGFAAEEILQNTALSFAVRDEYEIEPGEDGAILTVCRNPAAKLVLPSVIDGQDVTALSAALEIPGTAEEIILPDGVKRLDAGILSGKTHLKKVTLGSQTRVLGPGALKDCDIEELCIPGYLEEIGSEALMGTHLSELTLPMGLKKVGKRAFSKCFFSSITLPDGVEQIDEDAFSPCVNLKEIRLPEGIHEISGGLFENCINLEHVYIPDSATAIGMYAFRGCRAMETLLIPENITKIDVYAFAECSGLRYVAMPEKLDAANIYMFDGCPNDMILAGYGDHAAKKLADLKHYAFEDESEWNEMVVIGSNGNNTFALEEVDTPELILPSYDRNTQTVVTDVWPITQESNETIRRLSLPKYSTSIGAAAFINMTDLESVSIPDTLRSIGKIAFGGCSKLHEIDLPQNLQIIDDSAFMNCRSLTSLQLPDSIYHISSNAFWGCSEIRKINIPKSMSLLSDGIWGRTGIEEVTIPGNISKIRCAFFECENLKSADIQEGVRSLWESFAGCSSLETVTLPSSLEIISQNTFAGCSSLKDITFYSDNFIINDKPFISAITMCKENADLTLSKHEFTSIALPHDGASLEHLFEDCPEVTIHAHKGSFMEQYATEHGLNFEVLDE